MTFRVRVPEGTLVCRSTGWGDFEIVEYPAAARGFVEGLLETCGWRYAEETPYYILWDRIVPEDKTKLTPHIIHGIAVVERGADKLWKLVKDLQLAEIDLKALYLAATYNSDATRIRAWFSGIEFPPRTEIVKSLLETPRYVGVAVACATSSEIPKDFRVSRGVAEAILRELPDKYWTAQDWIRLVVASGHEDLLANYENDERVRPYIQEFYARDASRAWDIFHTAEDENARAAALRTLVRSGHPNAVDAVRTALEDTSSLVREAAFDHLDVLPRADHAKWLVHFAYHGIPGDYGETSKRAWYRIQSVITEEELAEFLAQKLR
jgi:hypothetical protein